MFGRARLGWWTSVLALSGCGARSPLDGLALWGDGAGVGGAGTGAGGFLGATGGSGGSGGSRFGSGGVVVDAGGGFGAGGFSTGGSVLGSGGTMQAPGIEPAELDAVPLELEFAIEFAVPEQEGPFQFALLSGTLPEGVELSSDGFLSGVPHEPGTFTFEVSAVTVGGDTILGSFDLVVEKQRFLAAHHFVSSSSPTTALTVYDLEEGGKVSLPHGQARFTTPTRMSPAGDWLLFSTGATEPDTTNTYVVYLGDGLGALSPSFLQSGAAPDCAFHPRGWGLACTIQGAQPVLSLFSIDGELMLLEGQVEGGKLFGFRENNSLFFEQTGLLPSHVGQLASLVWHERAPGLLTNFGIVGTKYVSPTGDRAITDWKDEGQILGIVVYDLEGWYSTNLISTWFAADEGYRFVETWDCPEGEPCDRRIHFISSTGELTRLFSESTEGWALPSSGVGFYEFAAGVRIFPRIDGILVDFLTETGSERDVILPLAGGILGGGQLSPDGSAIAWQETSATQVDTSYLALIDDGRLSDPVAFPDSLLAFSPSGRRLLVRQPVENETNRLIVLDTTQGALSEVADFTLPVGWVQLTWSRDESHIAIIGGNLTAGRRELHVVDLWDDSPAPELLEFCPPSTEAEPRCPNSVVF